MKHFSTKFFSTQNPRENPAPISAWTNGHDISPVGLSWGFGKLNGNCLFGSWGSEKTLVAILEPGGTARIRGQKSGPDNVGHVGTTKYEVNQI